MEIQDLLVCTGLKARFNLTIFWMEVEKRYMFNQNKVFFVAVKKVALFFEKESWLFFEKVSKSPVQKKLITVATGDLREGS